MHPLQPHTSYPVFNPANGFENVFRKVENYRYFLEKYRLYISPIAETYAYCLMPNHFHLVVCIRKREVIEQLILNSTFLKVLNSGKGEIENNSINNVTIEKYLSKQFANLFSCYPQSFNKSYQRMGSLFVKNFKREPIEERQHFLNAVIYTHRKPIHQGFCEHFDEWEYSSYFDIVNGNEGLVPPDKLFSIFGSKTSFINSHLQSIEKLIQTTQFEIP